MRIVPISLRKAAAHRELFDQINKFLSSKRLPHFWSGGRAYSDQYQLVLGKPGGMPVSIPLYLVYHQGQADEQTLDQGWRVPLIGPLTGLVDSMVVETPEPKQADVEADSDPFGEPPPSTRRNRRRAEPPEGE